MPSATPADVRAAIKKRALDPLYLILGDDEAEMARQAEAARDPIPALAAWLMIDPMRPQHEPAPAQAEAEAAMV